MDKPFDTILVANRGEIACRVIRSGRALGYRMVAVYSEADAGALHTGQADRAVCIGPAEARQSYLSIDAILKAAKDSGARAVHPGYGFLSENAGFAQACADAGLVFIGPPASAIAAMGNKAAAKRRMIEAGVPCVPGYQGNDQSDAALLREAGKIGLPLMVKAAAGGGGRGMRLVREPAELAAAITGARSEAENAFGSGELILEKAVIDGRHVEIQVFADSHGNVIHLGERDCSVQRRHQKVIEEAPSPAVDAALRAKMGAAAVAAAKAIGYVGAGTVEFLLDADGSFYFLEMNTRLQVEHPVTEAVTGLDLVALQIRVAAGEALPVRQEDVRLDGHALEARLYAEAPHRNFLPQSGFLARWQPPEGVRVDHGLLEGGQAITPFYDPMIAKIIAHGATREEARRRLILALERSVALGIETNRRFLIDLLAHPEFAAGTATTRFIPAVFGAIVAPQPDDALLAIAAILWFERGAARYGHDPDAAWSSNGQLVSPVLLRFDETTCRCLVMPLGRGRYRVGDTEVHVLQRDPGRLRVAAGGMEQDVAFVFAGDDLHIACGRADVSCRDVTYEPPGQAEAAAERELRAPMNGRIVAVLAAEGERVSRGQRIVVLEAMKMQHEMVARADATVDRLPVKVGDQVATKQLLVSLTPLDAAERP
ncbi:MAG TPA: biotin carboxylase N-terminal domain-containing protein [Ferrovibrio sp.]|uniref:acetyl/propionyl/methylcrotonyl-CoA carboxylase subunit alpha n=1 Tax=Ferrovibrio sp. TaxID=1917215 RepID=UPI002B4AE17C|nr:biotin carboxylase N-terminal domain-containing protein [Ferrovibrio sp.]HLT75790.1 biotin carboxylase N-terminal domain-containing protein [Ferrovibrio sp.]